jgi:hypothetical protein
MIHTSILYLYKYLVISKPIGNYYFFKYIFIRHYGSNNVGKCELKECGKRKAITPKEDDEAACGEGCVKETGTDGSCEEECNNKKHYENNTNTGHIETLGECVLKDCEDRDAVDDAEHVCGYNGDVGGNDECVKNEAGKCTRKCINKAHYVPNENGNNICVERECEDRKVNNEMPRVCGSGACYGQGEENDDDCGTSCKNPRLLF